MSILRGVARRIDRLLQGLCIGLGVFLAIVAATLLLLGWDRPGRNPHGPGAAAGGGAGVRRGSLMRWYFVAWMVLLCLLARSIDWDAPQHYSSVMVVR